MLKGEKLMPGEEVDELFEAELDSVVGGAATIVCRVTQIRVSHQKRRQVQVNIGPGHSGHQVSVQSVTQVNNADTD